MSVFVNTGTLQNREMAAKLEKQVEDILRVYLPRADRIAASVTACLRKEN